MSIKFLFPDTMRFKSMLLFSNLPNLHKPQALNLRNLMTWWGLRIAAWRMRTPTNINARYIYHNPIWNNTWAQSPRGNDWRTDTCHHHQPRSPILFTHVITSSNFLQKFNVLHIIFEHSCSFPININPFPLGLHLIHDADIEWIWTEKTPTLLTRPPP